VIFVPKYVQLNNLWILFFCFRHLCIITLIYIWSSFLSSCIKNFIKGSIKMFPGAKGLFDQMKFWNTVITCMISRLYCCYIKWSLLRHWAMLMYSYYPMLRFCPFLDLSSGASGMMSAVSTRFIYSTEYALSCPSVYCWANSWWSQSVVSCLPIVLHQDNGEPILWYADKCLAFTIFLFAAQPKEFFLDGLKNLEQRSHKCVELRGEYIE
jgi:hypothetical protein